MNTATSFKSWRQAMGFKTQKQAADALGYSLVTVKRWESDPEKHPVPPAVLLAMNALYHRLKPWPQ